MKKLFELPTHYVFVVIFFELLASMWLQSYHRLGAERENSVALMAKVPLPEVCVVFVLQLLSAYQKR